MSYNIKLFVHGVPPKGQQIWGADGRSNKYFESFYGRKASVRPQLLIESYLIDGTPYFYYTYWQNGNIIGRDGKTGSPYFALTLRIEKYYYADVVNIYNLLDAAFNKYIVDRVLQKSGENYIYKVTLFEQEKDWFKALELDLQNYLERFSSNSDFVSLTKIKQSNQNISCINLLECNTALICEQIKTHGCISISPLYPSMQMEKIIRQKEDNCTAQINAIKRQYADTEKQISKLTADLARQTSENTQLTLQLKDYKGNAEELKRLKAELGSTKQQLEKANSRISKINEAIRGLNAETFESHPTSNDTDGDAIKEKRTSWNLWFKLIHCLVSFLALVGIILLMLFPKNVSHKDKSKNQVEKAVIENVIKTNSDIQHE